VRWRVNLARARFGERGGMFFNLSHRLAVVDFLAAHWTLVEFQQRNSVRLTVGLARPVASNLFDSATAAGWTDCDFQHTHLSSEGFLHLHSRFLAEGVMPRQHRAFDSHQNIAHFSHTSHTSSLNIETEMTVVQPTLYALSKSLSPVMK